MTEDEMDTQTTPAIRLLGDAGSAEFDDVLAELNMFAGCRTTAELRDVLRAEVDAEVQTMLGRLTTADAFDAIELMRMHEFPPVPDPSLQGGGSPLTVEIIAALLLGRGSRKPDTETPRRDTRPHEVVGELHDSAQRLGRLATFCHQFEGRLSDEPLASLAAEYRSAVLNIRNLQYDSIRESQESQLFDNALVTPLMIEHLGYTYSDVVAVRESMRRISGDRLTQLRDSTADVLMRHPGVPPSEVPAAALEEFMESMIPFMFLPAERAVITADDVAAEAGIDLADATAVLESYAQRFDAAISPTRRVFDLLTSANPFQTTPLISDGAGNYVETTTGVGFDSLRRIVEKKLTTTSSWHNYDKKVRQTVSEKLTMEALENVLRCPPKLTGFKYYAPADNVSHPLLDKACPDRNAIGKQVEGDGLFIVGDVAICVEVKGKSISSSGRTGDVKRLWSDLKATIGDGCKQASRLQALIEHNSGIWLEDGSWLELAGVREIRSIVTLLDDVGPLGTSLGEHRQTGLLPPERTPWVTSLHDLQTISEVCDRPSEFLLYLRRRADSEVVTYYRASDELDLFALFMRGELYVEPDPDEQRALHPTLPHVTSRDRREHARDAVVRMVGDQCQELNAWMQRSDLDSDDPEPSKPTYSALERILELVDIVEEHDGTLIRFGADVLAMAGDAQQRLLDTIDTCTRLTREDGQSHDAMMSLAGAWGHPTIFMFTRPRHVDAEPVQRRFMAYIRLKRHQLRSDRSYGFLFREDGQLELVIYVNSPPEPSSEMDALVDQAKLRPVIDERSPVPPSGRRATRRLRGRKRSR